MVFNKSIQILYVRLAYVGYNFTKSNLGDVQFVPLLHALITFCLLIKQFKEWYFSKLWLCDDKWSDDFHTCWKGLCQLYGKDVSEGIEIVFEEVDKPTEGVLIIWRQHFKFLNCKVEPACFLSLLGKVIPTVP